VMEAIRSSETPVLKRATRRDIPEDDILHGAFINLAQRLRSSLYRPQVSKYILDFTCSLSLQK
jgi:hypothetical protein